MAARPPAIRTKVGSRNGEEVDDGKEEGKDREEVGDEESG